MKTLFWFRRDLRLFNNDALYRAIDNGCQDAVFFITEKQWQQHDVAPIQIDLLKRRLAFLGQLLADKGIHYTLLMHTIIRGVLISSQRFANSILLKMFMQIMNTNSMKLNEIMHF